MRSRCLIQVTALSLAALCVSVGCAGSAGAQPSYSISVDGAGNQVTFTSSANAALFEVTSESGLGAAQVSQVSGQPPTKLVIRLHLRGLEEFDFDYGATKVIVSVSSHGDNAVSESVSRGGSAPTPIGPASPYWMPVEVMPSPASGDQAGRSFSVAAPNDYLQGTYRAFSMKWIDFYR